MRLWNLHAIRVSLYGVNQDEYSETTTKRGAFERVTRNLISLLTARQQRDEPVKVGLNHIILPGRAHRLDALADYIARLNEASPSRPLDFLTVREDYSGRPDGLLAPAERAELRLHLRGFEQRMSELAPATHIDYGYALEAERMGVASRMLRIAWDEMRPLAHPQVAVQVDLLGDVYLYRESGFPGLPGADRYIAGRVGPNHGLGEVVAGSSRRASGWRHDLATSSSSTGSTRWQPHGSAKWSATSRTVGPTREDSCGE